MQTALPEAAGSPGLSGESLPARSSYSQILHCVFLPAGCSPVLSSAASRSDSMKRVTQQINCSAAYSCSKHYSNFSSSVDAEWQRTCSKTLLKEILTCILHYTS